MKRILLIAAVMLLFAGGVQAAMTYGGTYYRQHLPYAISGSSSADPIYLFMNEVETAIEAFGLEGDTYITMPTNGMIITNAVQDGRLEFTDNSETFGFYMNSNTVQLVTDSGVTVFDFNDVDQLQGVEYLGFEPVASVTATEGYVFYDSDDNTLKYRNDSSWVSLAAGTGDNTLDNAYDEGGAGSGAKIEADSGSIEIEVDDASSTDPALLIDVDDTTNDPTAIQITNDSDAANAISIDIDAQTTGRDIEGTGASFYVEGDGSIVGVDLDVTGAAGITLQNDAAITNAVDGAVKITEGGEDVSLTFNANTLTLSTSTAMDSVAFGVVDDLEGVGSITMDAAAASITLPSDGAAQDFTISVTGATDSTLALASSGTGADALTITTTAGGIDITNGGAAGGEDIDIDGVLASVNIDADEDVADAISINATAGGIDILADGDADKDLDLTCTNGSINLDGGEAIADAVTIAASAGGVDISSAATFDIDVTATGGKVLVSATEDAGNSIELQENGGTSGGINIYANQGTGVSATTEHDASVQLQSDDGGIGLYTTSDLANAIRIETNGGTNETLVLQNVQGTSVTEGAAAIELLSQAGGVELRSTADLANALALTSDGGTTGSILIFNDQGTSATEGSASIQMLSDDGGINIKSNLDNSNAILLTSDGGTSGTIQIHNDQGQGADSIKIISDDGGIDIDGGANADINIKSTSKSIVLEATEAADDAITLNPSAAGGSVSISDSNMTNVGDIYADDIIEDSNTAIMYGVKCKMVTIDVDDDASTDDFTFDDDAVDQVEQGVRVISLPAYSTLLACDVRCFETVTGSATMGIEIGTSSGGNEIVTTSNCDTANDTMGTAAAESPEVASSSSAIDVYVSGTPGVNWSTLDAGRWFVTITYIDNGAMYTQKNP